MDNVLLTAGSILVASILIILILIKPYFGIIFTMVSLPMVDLLPEIPFLSSVVILIGAATLLGFFAQKMRDGKPFLKLGSIHIISLLLVGWIFISNPEAAWFGVDRNWILTFIQLWVLIWLTSELMNSPKKQQVFMWIFSIVTAISAVIAIQQGNIGNTVGESLRAIGLAGNPNATARYFVLALMFFSYLALVSNKSFPRLVAIGGGIITFLGVFFTLSRTGIILLILALGLIILIIPRRKSRIWLFLAYISAALILWFSSESIFDILKSIMPSIMEGTDTIGLRYRLWQAAIQMWLDHPFQGVGIGMYAQLMRFYAPEVARTYLVLGVHNTYLQFLVETGLIGFSLILVLLITSLRNFSQTCKKDDRKNIFLRHFWLIVFLVNLVGQITLNGTTDKLLWFLMGVSVYFHNQFVLRTREIAVHKLGKNKQSNAYEKA